ncbi:MAG: hypothetical protein KF767_16395 [Bdellovibrionaceae bacterium]|nr:hypothetical protein [Pseudobdellovibrionaceae bacterium]
MKTEILTPLKFVLKPVIGFVLACAIFATFLLGEARATAPAIDQQSTTKVGNGDDGADLEHKEKVTSGILETTREKAAKHLKDMGTRQIPYLGNLIEEVERTEIYLVHQNIAVPKDFDKGQEVSPDGKYVYARTFARPYAATRFFPAALMLSEQQLINLHIHEALHRALPESVREDESVVSEITLALTDPNASFDRAKSITVAAVERAEEKLQNARAATAAAQGPVVALPPNGGALAMEPFEPAVTERLKRPSFFRYSFLVYDKEARDEDESTPVLGMQRLDSFLHPFGRGPNALGMGLSFSFVRLPDRSYLGPLQVSGRYLLATWRQFDVELYGEHSMYTLSSEELKNMPQARDVTTFGVSMRREGEHFYSENFLSYSLPSESEFTVSNTKYRQKFGGLTNASIAFGGKYRGFTAGLKGDLLLSQGYEVEAVSGTFTQPADRLRIVKFGPELGYNHEALNWKLFAYQIIDGTPGAKLDDVADLMGHGAGQGYAGTSLAIQF